VVESAVSSVLRAESSHRIPTTWIQTAQVPIRTMKRNPNLLRNCTTKPTLNRRLDNTLHPIHTLHRREKMTLTTIPVLAAPNESLLSRNRNTRTSTSPKTSKINIHLLHLRVRRQNPYRRQKLLKRRPSLEEEEGRR
jgi:hypothetical protein